jgi:hypothetical protein
MIDEILNHTIHTCCRSFDNFMSRRAVGIHQMWLVKRRRSQRNGLQRISEIVRNDSERLVPFAKELFQFLPPFFGLPQQDCPPQRYGRQIRYDLNTGDFAASELFSSGSQPEHRVFRWLKRAATRRRAPHM